MTSRLIWIGLVVACSLVFPNGASAQWQQLNGPRGTGIASLLDEDTVIYASGSFQTGEFFRSRDHGLTWELKNTGLPTTSENGSIVTSGPWIWLIANGLYRADRQQLIWAPAVTGFPANTFVSRVLSLGNRLFLSTNRGIYRSEDDGTTWLPVNNGIPVQWYNCFIPADSLLCIGSDTGTIFTTSDFGDSWTAVNTSTLPAVPVRALVIRDSLFVAGSDQALFRSTDCGEDWTMVPNVPAFYMVRDFYADSTLMLAAAFEGGILRSTDDGLTWQPADSGLLIHSVSDLEPGNGCIRAATRGGVFKSTDRGISWDICNDGLTCTSVSDLARLHDTLFSATYLGISRSTDRGETWEHRLIPATGPEGPYASCLHTVGSQIYAGTSGTWGVNGIFRSGDGGQTWTRKSTGLTTRSILDIGSRGTRLFAGTQDGLFRSDNQGESWLNVFPGETVYKLACSADSVYIACYSGVYASADDGLTWDTCNTGLTDPWFTALYTDGSSLFGGMARFYASPLNPVDWTAKPAGMTYPASLRAITSAQDLLFAGGAHGVWVANRVEQKWALSGFGAGTTLPVEALMHDDSLLYAATYRGIWTRPLAEMVQLDASPDSVVLAFAQDSTARLRISGNACWSLAGELPPWLSAGPAEGCGRDTVVFRTLAKNPSEEPRSVVLHVTAPMAHDLAVTVIQQGKPAGTGDLYGSEVTISPNPCQGSFRVKSDRPVQKIILTGTDGREYDNLTPGTAFGTGILQVPAPGLWLVTVVLADRIISRRVVSLDY